MDRKPSRISAQDFEDAIRQTIPLADILKFRVECLEAGYSRLRLNFDERQVRSGGTISGPILMTAADTALYGVVMSLHGMELLAVTSSLTIHFLRKPKPADLIVEGTLLRQGRSSIVGQVLLYSDGDTEPVAHVTGSNALPRA
jgi:acyl-coenzyme A thioesterase PaaI-like protein